jgi:hypothetical protein
MASVATSQNWQVKLNKLNKLKPWNQWFFWVGYTRHFAIKFFFKSQAKWSRELLDKNISTIPGRKLWNGQDCLEDWGRFLWCVWCERVKQRRWSCVRNNMVGGVQSERERETHTHTHTQKWNGWPVVGCKRLEKSSS